MTRAWRPLIDALVEEEPDTVYAEWTGDDRRALNWRRDGETYSPTALVSTILAEVGITPSTIPGRSTGFCLVTRIRPGCQAVDGSGRALTPPLERACLEAPYHLGSNFPVS
jgi:hypothetical protein